MFASNTIISPGVRFPRTPMTAQIIPFITGAQLLERRGERNRRRWNGPNTPEGRSRRKGVAE